MEGGGGSAIFFDWGSPKASHIKASQPHFLRFRVRVFAPWNLLRPLFFRDERDLPHFPPFPRIALGDWDLWVRGFVKENEETISRPKLSPQGPQTTACPLYSGFFAL